ncbi:SCO family protein [Zobellella endophytica]|uniref:SCO family protein n=1 Tax=Zobellella endophytica TaxID=2116700 RepID=A0A2P7R968_9GAMM|nr:SCO family protein [Zobellella endophytica]PSJ46749.1 SCO family protein [Zobellella endophytica]
MKLCISVVLSLGLCVSPQAHHGHQTPPLGAEPVRESLAATEAYDARKYFTDNRLLTQDGTEVRFYSDLLQDKVVVLNVVYTRCTDVCPLITRKLKAVRELLGEGLAARIRFISLSSDPAHDSPAVLKAFARRHEADDPHWTFLTGEEARMTQVLARLDHLEPSPENHSTLLLVGDVGNRRWSKIRPDASVEAIAQRLQLLSMPAPE